MRISRIALSAMIAGACFGGTAMGQTAQSSNSPYKSVSYFSEDAAPAAGCSTCSDASCDTSGCDSSGCDGLGCGGGFGLLNCCDLGDPWRLVEPGPCGWNIGGWSNVGYHSANTNFNFNNYDSRVQLQQQWFYAEKVADGSEGLGLGGRIDYLYGTDAPDTQAFGVGATATQWDNLWDNGGAYGHAIPQAYGQVAYGDLSVKVGKFFTIVGQEVVAATGNFFYSRQFTFYNAEPFTHTGALSTYKVDDETEVYNGWVSGWDSGFERNGSAYIGGFKRQLTEKSSFYYSTVLGRFGKTTGEDGSIHNFIFTSALNDNWTYISQTDVLYTSNGAGATQRNTFGNINYLLYKVNDCVSIGQRFEWFNFGGAAFAGSPRNNELYNYTVGINYKATANLMFRPEVRFVWDRDQGPNAAPLGTLESGKNSQAIFGTDMIFTF